MIKILEDIIDARDKFSQRLMNNLVDEFTDDANKQEEIEDKVLEMCKDLRDKFNSIRYNIKPYPFRLFNEYKNKSFLGCLDACLPGQFEFEEDFPMDDPDRKSDRIELAKSILPYSDDLMNDIKDMEGNINNIRSVAKRAPAGTKYAFDKAKWFDIYVQNIHNIKENLEYIIKIGDKL